jgi:hypothetical protein
MGKSKYTIDDMRVIAVSRGGKCLSNKYINSQTHLEWECQCGHRWSAIPNNIKNGRWCPKCSRLSGDLKRREKIENVMLLAKDRDGELLSAKYNNAHEKLEWRCKENHIFFMSTHDVKSGRWCMKCSHEKKSVLMRFDIKKPKELAKKRGGKCVSDEYINANRKLVWECKHGHRWKAIYNAIQRGQWCPYCNTQSRKEKVFRYVIETMLEIEFSKSRPSWLLNPKTGRRMEIDGYNKENSICFEYQGRQHSIYIPHMHRKYDTFLDGKERDRIKKKLIEQNGIFILYPDYKIRFCDYPYFIENKLNNTKFEKMIKNKAKTIDVNMGFSQ